MKTLLLRVLAAGVTLALTTAAWAATPVGQVLLSVGQAGAKSGEQYRALERRAEIFEGDTLITGPGDSQLQVRMVDGALIALGGDSRFEVKTYRFNQPGQSDEVVLSLAKGALRTVTGQADKSAYKMTYPTGTLGIRGTVYEMLVAPDGTATIVLREGAVAASSLSGQTVLINQPGTGVTVSDTVSSPGVITDPAVVAALIGILGMPTEILPDGTAVYSFDVPEATNASP